MLTEYGKLIRESRLKVGETLLSMSQSLKENVAYLSGTETGRIKVNDELLNKTHVFFLSKGLMLDLNMMRELSAKQNNMFNKHFLFKR